MIEETFDILSCYDQVKEENMSQSSEPKPSTPEPSLWSAIVEVTNGLKKQPILLLGFGIAILIFAAGTLAIDKLRVVAAALLILTIVVIAAWVLTKASALKASQAAGQEKPTLLLKGNKGGDFNMDKSVKAEDVEFDAGNVKKTGSGPASSNQGGNTTIGAKTELKHVTFHTGNVEENTDGSKK